jgi:hypothetical protein
LLNCQTIQPRIALRLLTMLMWLRLPGYGLR